MSNKNVRSSQEALAVSIKDWILNCGGLCKKDVLRISNMISLLEPLQTHYDEKIEGLCKELDKMANNYEPTFDSDEEWAIYCSPYELLYTVQLTRMFGEMWKIIHEEEIIPANMIMKAEEMEK